MVCLRNVEVKRYRLEVVWTGAFLKRGVHIENTVNHAPAEWKREGSVTWGRWEDDLVKLVRIRIQRVVARKRRPNDDPGA